MFKAIRYFEDLQDNGHPYHAGDAYPREGLEVTEERIAELASANNKQLKPLIEEIPDVAPSNDGSDASSDTDSDASSNDAPQSDSSNDAPQSDSSEVAPVQPKRKPKKDKT